MGLLDFTSKVLTEYKADISDHKAKIKQLTGAQKELAKAELEAAEARNKQLEDQKQGLGRIAIAAGAAFAAIKVGQSGLQEYIKYSDLAAQTNTATLDRLKAASGGLRSEMDLLSFSAKTQHASFKLTTDQQEIALKAMRALSKQGFDSTEVFDKVTQSLVTLQGDGLKEFGIQVDQGKTKAEAFKNIMAALGGEVAKTGGNLDSQTDDAKRLGVQWDDAMSNIKRAIGEIVVALGPLIGAVADLASAAGDVVRGVKGLLPGNDLISRFRGQQEAEDRAHKVEWDAVLGAFKIRTTRTASYSVNRINPTQIAQSGLAMTERFKDANEAMKQGLAKALGQDKIAADINRILDDANARSKAIAAKAKAGAGKGYKPGDYSNGFASDGLGFAPKPGEYDLGIGSGINVGGTFDTSLGASILDQYDAGGLQGLINDKGAAMAKDKAAASAARQSKLEQMFGPLSDFNAYTNAFDMLKGAVGAAFQAWIDGSKSIGAAVKGAISAMIGAKAVDMLSEALRHGAYAIGSLAFGDVKGAALHGTAAAKFAAGAVGLGVLAKALGGGSTTASAGGGGAAPVLSSPAQSGAPPRPVTVILGDEFAQDSPRRRQQRAALSLEAAKRVSSGDGGIIYG